MTGEQKPATLGASLINLLATTLVGTALGLLQLPLLVPFLACFFSFPTNLEWVLDQQESEPPGRR